MCLLSPVLGSCVCGVHTDCGCEVSVWRFTADLVTVLLFSSTSTSPLWVISGHYCQFLHSRAPQLFTADWNTPRQRLKNVSASTELFHEVCCLNKTATFYHPWKQDTFGSCVDFHIEDLYLTLAWMFVLFSSYWQSPLCKAQKSASGSIFYFTLTFLRFCVRLGGWPAWLRGAE